MSEAIVAQTGLLAAFRQAASIVLSAYVLEPEAAVTQALEGAADRGARVSVRLEGAPYAGRQPSSDLAERNRRVAAELRAHGGAVHLTTQDDLPVHMKAAVVDGVVYLDDRNWPADGLDTVVATSDADDVAAVTSALGGEPAADGHLATEKRAALRLEARAISAAGGDRIDVESESFGYSAVSKALYDRAGRGAHVRLLVAKREFDEGGATERAALRRLAGVGVEVRVVANDEKLCSAGDRGWIGSANATYEPAAMLDWGMETRRSALLHGIAAAFERNWAGSQPEALG
jgi:phosphatidylserine/phosphatidylglycerophosphate/cardiolipin synthase-like enzyme